MLKEEEEEIELDLGLSIGGSFRKPEKSKLGVELPEKERQSPSLSPPVSESAVPDPRAKREVQALRRQEAKRKREEKRSRGRSDGLAEEQTPPQPVAKKERAEANVNVNVNLNLSSNSGQSEPRCPSPYPPAQFVPYANGFAYPCVMPCNWTPAAGGGGFRPFKPHKNLGNNGCETEQNGGGVCRTTSLSASPICSASTASDHQSAASHEGGGSSDNRSHSNQGLQGKTQSKNDSEPKETKANSDHKATSNSTQSNAQFDGHKLATKEEPKSENTEPISIPKPEVSPTPSPPPPLKEATKFDPIAKPPKPQTQSSPNGALSQMPYVSTTGNGPNGKTIQGFLYSYTKSEISIVCVCHGSTFTPAEFVQHAGGTDVSQPLRHITVIPSAFGSANMI